MYAILQFQGDRPNIRCNELTLLWMSSRCSTIGPASVTIQAEYIIARGRGDSLHALDRHFRARIEPQRIVLYNALALLQLTRSQNNLLRRLSI